MSGNPFAGSFSDDEPSQLERIFKEKHKTPKKEAKIARKKSSDEVYRRSNQAVLESPRASARKAPAPKQRVKSFEARSYSQELFADKDIKRAPTKATNNDDDIVSVPTELGDMEDPDDYLQAAAEVKNRVAAEQQFEKAKARYKKKNERNLTRVVGTKRYNPFAFGSSVGTLVSSFGSNFETKKRKDLRKALYADDPLELYLVRGWLKMLTKDDQNDKDSVVSAPVNTTRAKIPFFGRTAKPRQEEMPEKTTRGANDSCFGMFKSCLDGLMGKQQEPVRVRLASGETDLDQSVTPSEAELQAVRQSYKPSVRNSSVIRGECVACRRRVKARDQLKKEEGNDEELTLHRDCVCCELCRVRVTTVVALRARENGQAVLCNKCSINVAQTHEAQRQLHSETVHAKKEEYLALVPAGYKLFLPVRINLGTTGQKSRGMIAMCTNCGAQLRKSDKETRIQGSERCHVTCPRPEKLRSTLKNDIKMIAAGIETEIELGIKGFNGMLRNPIEEVFTFKCDQASLQYDLRQAVKSNFKIIYNLHSPSITRPMLKLDQVRASSLLFSGTLKENFGPFLANHIILRQEQDSRLTGKTVELEGRYEHGILYDLNLRLFLNEAENTLTPISVELILRMPQVY